MQAALDADGAVIIEGALTRQEADRIVADMRPFIEATPARHGGFPTDDNTRRCGALVARSPASHKAVMHPAVVEACKRVLGEQRLAGRAVQMLGARRGEGRYPWRLSLTQIIDVGRGSRKQMMHRGNGLWQHDFGIGLDPQVETMWALTDFTADNGATHVIPGSHRWGSASRGPGSGGGGAAAAGPRAEPVQASMPKGSVLIWTGWTVHGAGVNRTVDRRIGLNIDYVLAFLQTEENQFLACPPRAARALPAPLQRMLGWRQPRGLVYGTFAEVLPPDTALRDGYDVTVPGGHGLRARRAPHDGLTPAGAAAARL